MLDSRLLVAALLLAGCTPGLADDDDSAVPEDPLWAAWLDERDDAVADLAEPILDCTQTNDTSYPVFRGCYDWHSAVHGFWALHAATRLLGDPQYLDVADSLLTPEAISGELAILENGGPLNEIPYGYAWFLRLAAERADAGRDGLAPLADVVAEGLAAWVDGIAPSEVASAVLSDDYGNASWAVVNLHRYALDVGDVALADRLESFVRDDVLPVPCSLEQEDEELDDFFPPCLHRALVITQVLPTDEVDTWLADWLPEDPELAPVAEFPTAHPAGLNFSRAWGLQALYAATGDVRWRHLWLDHVQTHLAIPEYWREDYLRYSHWVPQFGILAIALTD